METCWCLAQTGFQFRNGKSVFLWKHAESNLNTIRLPIINTKERHSTVYPFLIIVIIFYLPWLTRSYYWNVFLFFCFVFPYHYWNVGDKQTRFQHDDWYPYAFRKCFVRSTFKREFTHHFFLANFCIEFLKTFIKSTASSQIFVILKQLQFAVSFLRYILCQKKALKVKSNITKCFGYFKCLFAVTFVRYEVHA